jgi:AraC family transcriptional activator of tynA and feaB
MQPVQVFSTHGVPAPRKVEMWNSMLGGLIDAMEVQSRDPWHFDGTLIRQRIGPLTMFEVRCTSVSVRHQRTLAARNSHPTFQVLMPLESEFTLTHGGGKPVTVGDGSSCLIDRTAPYEMVHGHGVRTIGVEFPHAMLEGFLPQAIRHGGAVADQHTPAGRVLAGLLRTLGSELTKGGAAQSLPSMIARCIAGFVAAAFRNPAQPQPGRGSRLRIAAYREYVESRLGDGDLRPVDVARHFGVSERYVRLVFQSSGEPLSAFLLRIRLARAAELLRNDYYAQHTITGIALECGFNNASHFGQCFRDRYGQAPRDFREATGS